MNLKRLIPTYHPIEVSNFNYKFTVFTPVYNRAKTIHRVFNSLNNQTFKDFELVVINDGSTDNSHTEISKLIATASFPVNYINNSENKHKMSCFFQAINVAQGEFLLTLDSDDECTEDALAILNKSYDEIPKELKKNISGVTGLCMDQFGKRVGEKFPEQPYYSNTFSRLLSNPKSSEKWGFTKTQLLKSISIDANLFGQGLIPEGLIWNLIAKQGFKTKYINDMLRTYYLDSEDSLSIKNHKKDALGMTLYSLSILNWFHNDYFKTKPKEFIKRIYTLLRASRYLNFKFTDYMNAIDSKFLKLIVALGWPIKGLLK